MAIELSQGFVAWVDPSDYHLVSAYKWCLKRSHANTLYAHRRDGKKWVLMHRQILQPAPGVPVDHRDGNGLNNRRENLRTCNASDNCQNRGKGKGAYSCKYKGVTLEKRKATSPYRARIKINGRLIGIGYFGAAKEAALAYDAKARELFGEFARPNFKSDGVK